MPRSSSLTTRVAVSVFFMPLSNFLVVRLLSLCIRPGYREEDVLAQVGFVDLWEVLFEHLLGLLVQLSVVLDYDWDNPLAVISAVFVDLFSESLLDLVLHRERDVHHTLLSEVLVNNVWSQSALR